MITIERTRGFAAQFGAYAASEAAAKASRLAVVLVVARAMEAEAIGLAAAAMAASDLLKAFTENGVSQRIIQARDSELQAVCRRAHSVFWAWCGGLFAVQTMLATALWLSTGDWVVPALLALLGAEYLFMPGGLVQCALAMREGRLSFTAMIAGTQVVGANLLTALLALFWPSPLAIVLPKLLSSPVWLVGMRRLRPWTADRGPVAPLRHFTGFGAAVLGVEVVKAIRLQADKLVIGGLLGAEALGLWFFAVSAGLGLTTSFGRAFTIVLFPHLCNAEDREQTLARAFGLATLILFPVVLLQAALAPVYVPVLFGERWAEMAGLVSILCLCAIPDLAWSATAQWLRAGDRAGTEFRMSAALAFATVLVTAALAPFGLETVAWGTLAAAVVIQLGACIAVLLPVIRITKEA